MIQLNNYDERRVFAYIAGVNIEEVKLYQTLAVLATVYNLPVEKQRAIETRIRQMRAKKSGRLLP